MVKKAKTTTERLQRLDEQIKRVRSRAFRWNNKLNKLLITRGRVACLVEDDEPKPVDKPVDLPKPDPIRPNETAAALQALTGVVEKPDDLDIRKQDWSRSRIEAAKKRDEVAKQAIQAEQVERKRTKSRIRIEEMKAKKAGKTKAMPLIGKAALAAIRESE